MMQKSGIIPLFTICNREYLAFALVMIRSVLAHTQRSIHFHILHDPSVRKKDLRKMERLLAGEKNLFQVTFREMKGTQSLKTWGKRFPPLVYYRLLIPESFPEYDRCIYLDSDILLRGEIGLLYDTDLQGNMIGAVEETSRKKDYADNIPLFGKFADMGLQDYCRKIGLDPSLPYCNSGVLLMDSGKIRSEGMERIRKALSRAGDELLYPDQDLLNLYFHDSILLLDPVWNVPVRRDVPPEGTVLHYVSKVWHNSSVDADKALYFQELRKTPFFYSVRAELILYEMEATVNSAWRSPGDNLWKALVRLFLGMVVAITKRIRHS